MKLIKKPSFLSEYGLGGKKSLCTPYYFSNGERELFILNLFKDGKDGMNRWNMAVTLSRLRRAKGGYIALNRAMRFENPMDYLGWVEGNGYTYERVKIQCFDGFWDVSGSIVEYSAAFYYRIYSPELVETLKGLFEAAPMTQPISIY